MKKVFLDLGTHYGQGLNEFINKYNMDDSWIIHTFEANPETHKIFINNNFKNTPWVNSHLEAVSDHDGVITINMETPPGEGATGMGSSVIPLESWDPWGGKNHEPFKTTAEVPCIDLSNFIKNNFDKKDFIIVKMDIEGAECDTLSKMIDDNTIDYINELYVEWHHRCFPNPEEKLREEQQIIEKIQKYNIKLESWI
jgi:FkbM family methyltransferase